MIKNKITKLILTTTIVAISWITYNQYSQAQLISLVQPKFQSSEPSSKTQSFMTKLKINKIISSKIVLSFKMKGLIKIELSANKKSLIIQKFIVSYRNGKSERFYAQEGRLSQTKYWKPTSPLNSTIQSIKIKASSQSLIGKRPELTIKVHSKYKGLAIK